MARVLGISLMNGVATLATTFGGTFATNQAYGVGMNTKLYLFIPVIGNAIAMILIPYIGNLSDRIGRRPCMPLVGRPIDAIPLAGNVLEPTRASRESCLGSLRQAGSAGWRGWSIEGARHGVGTHSEWT